MTGHLQIPDPDGSGTDHLRRRRPRWQRAGVWCISVISLVATLAAFLVVAVVGRTVDVPDWVLDRVETRLEHSLNGLDLEFGDLDIVINEGWRPRARLRDVVMKDQNGVVLAQLADASASLAMRPMLQGNFHPKSISFGGGLATLRRDAAGAVSLVLEDPEAPVQEATGLLALIDGLEGLLLTPMLSDLVSVEFSGMTLQYEDARAGRTWLADGGYASLKREGDAIRLTGNVAVLGGGTGVSTLEMNYEGQLHSAEATFGLSIGDVPAQAIASQSAAMAWLSVLRAPITGSMRGTVDDGGELGPLYASLHIGAGALQPSDTTRPIRFEGARSYFEFDPQTETIRFDDLAVTSDWLTGEATGDAILIGLADGALDELVVRVEVSQLSMNPAGVYPEPLVFTEAAADFRMRLDPFEIDLGQMHVASGDTDVLLEAELDAAADGWRLAVNGQVDKITPEALMVWWPPEVSPKPRRWVDVNLSGGMLENTQFAVRAQPQQRPDIYLNFDFFDSTIQFLKTMPPIEGAAGRTTLLDGRFVVSTTDGQIKAPIGGAIDITGTSFIIPDVGIRKRAPGVVRAKIQGDLPTVLSVLNEPPLQILRDVDLPVTVARGTAQASGTLSLPLAEQVAFEEISFHVDGALEGVTSDILIPGDTVAANSLRLTASQDRVRLSGTGTINGVPAQVAWQQDIGPDASKGSAVKGNVELSPQTIQAFDIGLPDGAVGGSGMAEFVLDLPEGGPPRLNLTSDLSGVTLAVPELGWRKSAAQSGRLNVQTRLGPDPAVETVSLDAGGLSLDGTIAIAPDGGMERAQLNRVQLSDWLDAQVELTGRGPDLAPNVRIVNGHLDLRRATFGPSTAPAQQPGDLAVALDRLQITEEWALTDFRGAFDLASGLSGPFQGKINGQADVRGELIPQNGRSAFRITSADAGGVFRAAGLLTQAHGGDLSLVLQPREEEGAYNGTLVVERTQVKDAPSIAALLNAVSIVGLINELSGAGIQFARVDARFGLNSNEFTLYEASAVGPSIGLTMDGRYNLASKILRMQGTITPAYLINGIGQVVSRRGEGLFGFNYSLSGPATDPSVSVNPLSALAPGFMRELFRSEARPRDPTQKSQKRYSDKEVEER